MVPQSLLAGRTVEVLSISIVYIYIDSSQPSMFGDAKRMRTKISCVGQFRGRSRISGKGVHMYGGGVGSLC